MATRKKTIRVPVNFGNHADIASSTNSISGSITLGTPTIYIEENLPSSPVTFNSVMLFLTAQDTSTVTGGSIAGFSATTQMSGASTALTVNIATATLANSGENWGGLFGPIDVTNHFITNFGSTGTSKQITVKFGGSISTGTGTAFRGVYGYFDVTYTYVDTGTTRTQTICIPYESGTSTLTTTANTTFAVLPNLTGANGWLSGYTSPVVTDRWIEIKGNCNNNNTATNHGLIYAFNGGTGILLPQRLSTLGTDTYQIYQIDAFSGGTLSTSSQNNFQLWNSLATRWSNIIVNEWVTFNYITTGTTEVLNYIEALIEFNSPINGTTSAVNESVIRTILIQEPNPIRLLKGAIEVDYNAAASATPNIRVGNQSSYRAYGMAANTVGGGFSFQHNFDSGATLGAGVVLQRGENSFATNLYRSAGAMSNVSGVIKLLYSSGVSDSGIDAHNHWVTGFMRGLTFTTTADVSVSDSFIIPENNYYIVSAGLQYNLFLTSALSGLMVQARVLTGETVSGGFRELYKDIYISDSELGYTLWNVRARDEFKRYPRDTDTSRLNIQSARNFRTTTTTAGVFGIKWTIGYNSIYSGVSGTISGSAGGVIDVDLFSLENDGVTHTIYDSTTITGSGAYNFVVYDDTKTYMVTAHETNTLKGVSKLDYPGSGFDINLSSSGGSTSVTTGYAGG